MDTALLSVRQAAFDDCCFSAVIFLAGNVLYHMEDVAKTFRSRLEIGAESNRADPF